LNCDIEVREDVHGRGSPGYRAAGGKNVDRREKLASSRGASPRICNEAQGASALRAQPRRDASDRKRHRGS
jgi:hypothetical protein